MQELSFTQPPGTELTIMGWDDTPYSTAALEIRFGAVDAVPDLVLTVEADPSDRLWDQLARIPQVRERVVAKVARDVQGVSR